jgi:prepilin-type N-terminal cleavage/methylation domain-containing protein
MPIHHRPLRTQVNSLQRKHQSGFSLVELLVVVSILIMLISMILPAIAFVRESARRIACASNQRQLFMGAQNWSADHDGRLPVADRKTKSLNSFTDRNGTDHISWVSESFYDVFANHQGMELHQFTCPNRGPEFVKFEGKNPERARMGFYIMWGRDIAKWKNKYAPWVSPQHMFHPSPMSMIVTGDIIESGTWKPPSSSASHTHTGGTGFGPKAGTPTQMGADGGNLGYLDGSVFWVQMKQMERHDASSGGSVSGWW